MISDRIKELREKNAMSQSSLAQKLNTTRSSVNAWEMGISVPSVANIVELSMLFHVSTDYLLCIEGAGVKLDLEGLSDEEIKILYSLVDYFNKKRESQIIKNNEMNDE